MLDDRVAGAEVPPADFAVFGGGREDVIILVPDDGLDGAAVDAGADLVAGEGCSAVVTVGGRWEGGRRAVAVAAAAAAAREVEDAQLLLISTGSEDTRGGLDGEGNGAADVRMLQRVQTLSGVSVPDLTSVC